MVKNLFFFFLLFVFSFDLYSQTNTVGIGTKFPNENSALDIFSRDKGVLLPSMTEAQMNAIPAPAIGLIVFQTDGSFGFRYFDGVSWKPLGNIYTTPPLVTILNPNSIEEIHFKNNSLSGGDFAVSSFTSSKIKDSTITNSKLIDNTLQTEDFRNQSVSLDKFSSAPSSATDGSIIVWNDTDKKWAISEPPSSNINFRAGGWDASTNFPALADGNASFSNGDFYTVSVSGSQDLGSGTINFSIGDWVIYNGKVWSKISNSTSIISVFGRSGDVVAEANDYSWEQIDFSNSKMGQVFSDVTTFGISSNDLVKWNSTTNKWEPSADFGTSTSMLKSAQIANDAVTNIKVSNNSVNTVHYKDQPVSSRTLGNLAVSNDDIADGTISIEKFASPPTLPADGQIYYYDTISFSWKTKAVLAGLNFKGIYEPTDGGKTPFSDEDPSARAGDYYIVSIPPPNNNSRYTCTIPTFGSALERPSFVRNQDWFVYNGSNFWIRIEFSAATNGVLSFNGRTGIIEPRLGDYDWDDIDKTTARLSDIENIDLSAAISSLSLLTWDDTKKKFVPQLDHGSTSNPLDTNGISTGVISTNHLVDSSVTLIKIKAEALTNPIFEDKSIQNFHIKNLSITADKFANTQIFSESEFGASVVDSSKIKPKSIEAKHIAQLSAEGRNFRNGSISSAKINTKALSNDALASKTIDDAHFSTSSISNVKFVDNTITGNKFTNNSITQRKLTRESIVSANIEDNTIINASLNTDAITKAKIEKKTIDSVKIESNTISTAKLSDDNTITSDKIVNRAINSSHIGNSQVTTANIQDKTVENNAFADNTVPSELLETSLSFGGSDIPSDLSILDMSSSSTQGFLPPRMTRAQKNTLSTVLAVADAGLMVYDTDRNQLFVWTGQYWDYVGSNTVCPQSSPCAENATTWQNAEHGDFIQFNSLTYGVVFFGGRYWLDRNLGASRLPSSIDDTQAYGHYYQWGRSNDGHQSASTTTTTKATSFSPGHSDFITAGPSDDWLATSVNTLWQPPGYQNNPCPPGWKVPTFDELYGSITELFSILSSKDKFKDSPLHLIGAGFKQNNATVFANGLPDENFRHLSLWTSSLSTATIPSASGQAIYLQIETNSSGLYPPSESTPDQNYYGSYNSSGTTFENQKVDLERFVGRAYGINVRCTKQ